MNDANDWYVCDESRLHCSHCGELLLRNFEWQYKPWFKARVIVSHMKRKHPNVTPITRVPVSRSAMYRATQRGE